MNEENKMVLDDQWPQEEEHAHESHCPLCDRDVPDEEMIYAVCEQCLTRNETLEQAFAYGAHSKTSVKINALFAKALTDDQINTALYEAVMRMYREYPLSMVGFARETVTDDSDDFAHWLLEQDAEQDNL